MKFDFPENETSRKMRFFAFMGISCHGIWKSWIFKHHGYSDIMDIWISRIFKYHRYSDMMDTRTSNAPVDLTASLQVKSIDAAGSRRTFPHFFHYCFCLSSAGIDQSPSSFWTATQSTLVRYQATIPPIKRIPRAFV